MLRTSSVYSILFIVITGAFLVPEYPHAMIDHTAVQELRKSELDQNYVIGAGLTLTELLDILKEGAKVENFSYFEKLYTHIELVAHIPIRNVSVQQKNSLIRFRFSIFCKCIYFLALTFLGFKYACIFRSVLLEET